MSLFECPRIDDAAGYVLRAMPDSDTESYRHHVTECEECAAKVAELGFVSHALLNAVPQLSAPPEIRDRVMSVVRAEAELLQAAGAGADQPPRPAKRRFDWGLGRLRPVTAGALAALLLVLVLGGGALMNERGAPCTTRSATAIVTGSNASGKLTVCDGDTRIAFDGMDPLGEQRVYVTWLVGRDGRPKPVGAPFIAREGKASVDLGKLADDVKVLVTDEPAPGDTLVPSLPPVAGFDT